MKLTIDNMIIEGTVEECYEFKKKLELDKKFLNEKFTPYQPPTYIGTPLIPTPVAPYEPNRIWCKEKDNITRNEFGEIIGWYV